MGENYPSGTYHNHTTWSDGVYTPEQLVERAIQLGFTEVGITDHYLTLKGGINCVKSEQIADYISMIDQLRKKYLNTKILSSLEIDVSMFNLDRNNLPFDKLNKLDYVLFEYVDEQDVSLWAKTEMRRGKMLQIIQDVKRELEQTNKPEELESAIVKYIQEREDIQQALRDFEQTSGVLNLEDIIKMRKSLTCKVGLAHPNMENLIKIYGAEDLAKFLSENDIFVDVCGSARNSKKDYTDNKRGFVLNAENLSEEFNDAARSYGVKFSPSSDTHKDNERDSMKDTLNATQLIQINDWAFQEF
ncbi:PHP domain-containing protein [archaeon]|nr:PHP domain-containing protein [archaeon]